MARGWLTLCVHCPSVDQFYFLAVFQKRSPRYMPKRARTTKPVGPVYTKEPIDADGLRDLASRKAAAHLCWPGSNVDIRTVLLATIARAEDGYLTAQWDESAYDYGFPTRRWTTQSLFSLPRLLKAAGRHGLHNAVDIDQDNAHFNAQLTRHRSGRPALIRYVRERDAVLSEVQEALGVSRTDAKHLFLVICYHGSVRNWCRERGVSASALPAFIAEFVKEQKLILQEDARQHPDLLAKAKASGVARPEVTLQSHLNMRHEREVLDAMAAAARGTAEVASYEHDGIYFYTDDVDRTNAVAGREWRERLLNRIRATVSVPVSIKEQMSLQEALLELKQKWPDEDWVTKEPLNEDQARLTEQARAKCDKGRQHSLYAEIVALEERAWPDLAYTVKQVFKHLHSGVYAHWDRRTRRWTQEHARDILLHVIGDILRRGLTPWTATPEMDTDGKHLCHLRYLLPPESLYQVNIMEAVEKLVRPLLRDPGFRLDDQRHLLLFQNCVYDRVRDEWQEIIPARAQYPKHWLVVEEQRSDRGAGGAGTRCHSVDWPRREHPAQRRS